MTRLTIFVFILCSVWVHSQEEVTYNNLRSLREGELFIRFQVMELDDSKKVNLDKDEVYYWFKSQKVMTTQGGASGVLLHGIYEEFYPNSQLKVKGNFKKGVKHGDWMYWDENGNLMKVEHWRKGKRVKDVVKYDASGKVLKKQDVSANQTIYYSDKKTIKTWNDSSEVQVIHKYDNGETKKVERYEEGRLEGKQVKYDSEGEMIYLKNYKDGKLHGKQIDEDGNKTYFKHGEPHTPLLKRLFEKKEKEENEELEKEEETEKEKDKEKQDESDKD